VGSEESVSSRTGLGLLVWCCEFSGEDGRDEDLEDDSEDAEQEIVSVAVVPLGDGVAERSAAAFGPVDSATRICLPVMATTLVISRRGSAESISWALFARFARFLVQSASWSLLLSSFASS
jgi:hypothetical protein